MLTQIETFAEEWSGWDGALIRWLEAVFTARGVWLASRYDPRGEITES
ncbi:MAG: hypothetical protein ACRDST_01845 [Pseudonocardiaceae bacterium]